MGLSENASKGGRARAESLSQEERTEIASNAAKVRWAKSKLPSKEEWETIRDRYRVADLLEACARSVKEGQTPPQEWFDELKEYGFQLTFPKR